jgi:hypothetical protein
MIGAIPPLPNTPLWRGAQLKHRDNFTSTIMIQRRKYLIISVQFRENPGNVRVLYQVTDTVVFIET